MKKTLISTALVSLCLATLIGCDDRDRRPGSDAAVKNEIRKELDSAKIGGSIDIAATNGIVTLTGQVSDFAAKMKAEDVAQRVPGVTKVKNDLRTVAAADAPERPAVNLPPPAPGDSNVPPEPEVR